MNHPMQTKCSIRRILFATDFSENSRAALDYTRMFALRFRSTVYMLHVMLLSEAAQEAEIEIAGPSLSRESAERRLETLAGELRQCGIEVETHVVEGFVGSVVPQSVLTYGIDLLVLGIHGLHHGLTYLLMGSTTELLMHKAQCPVLTVGANVLCGFNLDLDLDRVLFVSDFSPEAAFAAPFAFALADALKVPVELGVWISDQAQPDERLRLYAAYDYCQKMMELVPANRLDWCTPGYQMRHAMNTEALVTKAAQAHDGLVVLGIHSLNTSFARLVLSRSSCPVITMLREPTPLQTVPV